MATTPKQTTPRRKPAARRTRRTMPPSGDQPTDEIYEELRAEASTRNNKGLLGRLAEWATTSARALKHAVRPHHVGR